MKMFIVNNEYDAELLTRFVTMLKDHENQLLDELKKIGPFDEKYKDILNTFNTDFSIRTAVEDGIKIFNDTLR